MSAATTYDEAVDLAVRHEMERDPRIFFLATDPPDGLAAHFGPQRVRQTPISEPSLTGMCVGAAMCGLRPIFLWRNVTFGFGALDPVFNQAAKLRFMLGGQVRIPLVIRVSYGAGTGLAAQHMQSPYAMFAAMPGLKVVAPSTGEDAYGLMRTALLDDNPVVFFEGVRLSPQAAVVPDTLGEPIPFGVARTARAGDDVTIVAIGHQVHEALAAAADLAAAGIDAEVIDPRTLAPLDTATVTASVRRTGRLVVVDEAPAACSIASEIVTSVCEDPAALSALRTPPRRICAAPVPIPYTRPLEQAAVPSAQRIADAVRDLM
ncbi:transketolase C-terminal domain-containing protein [Micromonospora sp. NPDC047793]|uniref:alpha-ketoacid dehydrogenase subunit beta n=1 Tax=unclassified Micromonospora TaxID=2617518 RepID=UPI0010343A07|nr:transketolase C-terminal domain-containing protein [Verrucosispora sp. SN26_14.1]TBL44525.1 alpha-ketoacid dehydrogenase subunit beta [Verrucosispora sp. SN26_14.1]